jgi:hypothetical protein
MTDNAAADSATPAAPVAPPVENTGLKGLFVTLYQRVILSYKTTLVGIGLAVAGVIVDNLTHSSNKTITSIAVILGSVLALIKEPGAVKP